MNLLGKIWTVVYALLAALAAILSLPVIAFLIALGFVRFNDAVGWFELGEWHAWLGIIFAMYALYAGIVVGPLVWWRICAKRFDLPHKVNTVVTIGLVVFFGIICAWIVHGEQPTTNQIRLEAVSDDGNLVIVQKILRGSSILYVIDISSGQVNRLTANADGFEGAAGFSPDGKRVVFSYSKDEKNFQVMLADYGQRNERPLLPKAGNDTRPSFSRDGQAVYFTRDFVPDKADLDLYSASLDGRRVNRVSHETLKPGYENLPRSGPVLSTDRTRLLFSTEGSLYFCPVTLQPHQSEPILFPMPDSPAQRTYESAYFAADDQSVVFMAANEGQGGYNYDVYRLSLTSRQVEKITATKSYASDFRVSVLGKKAVFLKWKTSRFQHVPRSFQMQLMDMASGTVTPVNVAWP